MGAKYDFGVAGVCQQSFQKQAQKILQETSALIELLAGSLSRGVIVNIDLDKSLEFDWPVELSADSLNERDLFMLYSEDKESTVSIFQWSNCWEFTISIPIESPRIMHVEKGEFLTSLWSATQAVRPVVAFSGEELGLGNTLEKVIGGSMSPTTLKTCDEFIISTSLAKKFGITGLQVTDGVHYRYSC